MGDGDGGGDGGGSSILSGQGVRSTIQHTEPWAVVIPSSYHIDEMYLAWRFGELNILSERDGTARARHKWENTMFLVRLVSLRFTLFVVVVCHVQVCVYFALKPNT